jgi:predicted DNA-binding transcriptional regulator AlpA
MKEVFQIDPEAQLSSRQACRLLGCSLVTLWRFSKLEDFPKPARFEPENPRSRLRWDRRQLLLWCESRRRRTAEVKAASAGRGIHGAAVAGACVVE